MVLSYTPLHKLLSLNNFPPFVHAQRKKLASIPSQSILYRFIISCLSNLPLPWRPCSISMSPVGSTSLSLLNPSFQIISMLIFRPFFFLKHNKKTSSSDPIVAHSRLYLLYEFTFHIIFFPPYPHPISLQPVKLNSPFGHQYMYHFLGEIILAAQDISRSFVKHIQ